MAKTTDSQSVSQEDVSSVSDVLTSTTKKIAEPQVIKVGLANRKDYPITIVLSNNKTLMLNPNGRTNKEFKKEDIISVNGKSLMNALDLVMVIN